MTTIYKSSFKQKHHLFALVLVFVLLTCGGCRETDKQQVNEPMNKTAFALDTIISITIYDSNDESLLVGAIDLINKYERIYSRTMANSELYKLNNRTLANTTTDLYGWEISDQLRGLIEYGLSYSELSNGVFDITIEPLSSLWDFKAKDPKVPKTGLITDAVKEVSYENIELRGNIISFKSQETRIDLGAIAKGYIADKVKEYLISQGVKSALINLGGNVLCLGQKNEKEAFKIGIQKPFADRNEIIGAMDIRDMSVVTSGIYERYFVDDSGVIHHHILNPMTGYPYDNNLLSVTIISPTSVQGDALSTTCFALGLDGGMDLIKKTENTHGIFITKDYEFYYSEGFHEDIKVRDIK